MKTRTRHPLVSCLPLLLLLVSSANLLAEEGGGAHEGSGTILQQIMHGGPMIIMIWLAILTTSIIMVTFIIQNVILLRNSKLAPPELVEALKNLFEAGNYQEAWQTCKANNNYLANVLRVALERFGLGKEAVAEGIAEGALREATILRTRNSYLSVIGVVSPMIGLLGTVIGMMNAFATLASSGISNPRALSASIGEVLMATASGLFIAIPAFIAYYVFRNRTQMVVVHADDIVNRMIAEVPFDELQGVRLGENFSAGAGAPKIGAGESRKVSMALTTNCPVCNGAVTPGANPCPHCGATLQWAN